MSAELPRQAVILAAGEGMRLRPVTAATPKPLVPFFGRPLLDWAVRAAVDAGVARIAVNACHLADQVAARVADLARLLPHVEFHISRETELLGTGGALVQLADHGWFHPGAFWVINSDAVFEASLRDMAIATSPLALMTHVAPESREFRRLLVTPDGLLAGLDPSAPPDGQAFCGVTLADHRLIAALPSAGPACILRDGVLRMLPTTPVRLYPTSGFFADTGTPASLVDAHLRGIHWVQSLSRCLPVVRP
jgi:NDP-sugar pyrophosphorylase family protein